MTIRIVGTVLRCGGGGYFNGRLNGHLNVRYPEEGSVAFLTRAWKKVKHPCLGHPRVKPSFFGNLIAGK